MMTAEAQRCAVCQRSKLQQHSVLTKFTAKFQAKKPPHLLKWERIIIFATENARMAESVDALVSNTNGAIRAGSTPAQGTETLCYLLRFSMRQSVFLFPI